MRLIDADKAKEKLRSNAQNDGTAFVMVIVKMFCEFLDQVPTVEDAEEHGEIGRVPRWIPVTERLPEDDYVPGDKTVQIKVIVCNVNNGSRSIRTLTRCWDRWLSIDGNVREWKWRWTWSKNVRDNEITHWMPLFGLPKVVE